MKWKQYPRNIKARLLTSFFSDAVSSAVMPFMALFLAHEKNKVWAGAFLLSTVVIKFIVNLIGGYISDRFQRKKVLVVTSALSAIMLLFMTISLIPEQNMIWLFALAYVLFIVVSNLGKPAMLAIIIDSTTPENRKAVYAIEYWFFNLAMAMGASLGGLMFVNYQIALFAMLTITTMILPIAYQFWLVDENQYVLEKKHENVLLDLVQNYKIALQDLPFVKVVIGVTFIMAAEFSLNNYIGVRLSESFKTMHLGSFELTGVRMLSLLNIQNMLTVVCLAFIVNKITDRFSKSKVLLAGLLLYGIGYVTITSANIWYLLIVFNMMATIGELTYSPVLGAEQANMIPADKRGSYSAFSNISFT
jgi:MFS family permease